jgi:hypothetical protein
MNSTVWLPKQTSKHFHSKKLSLLKVFCPPGHADSMQLCCWETEGSGFIHKDMQQWKHWPISAQWSLCQEVLEQRWSGCPKAQPLPQPWLLVHNIPVIPVLSNSGQPGMASFTSFTSRGCVFLDRVFLERKKAKKIFIVVPGRSATAEWRGRFNLFW